MKPAHSALIAIGILLALPACASAPQPKTPPPSIPAEVPSSASASPSVSKPTPTTPAQVLGKAQTHKLRIVTSDGFTQSAVLTLYPGVPGRSSDQLAAGWRSVRGTGAVPCDSGMMSTGVMQYELDRETAYYVFGTLKLTNETTDFDPKEIGWSWISSGTGNSATQPIGVLGIGYSTGAQCSTLIGTQSMMVPKWASDSWGPVPVVIGLPDVYTPKMPQGNRAQIRSFLFGVMATRFPGTVTIDGHTEQGLMRPWLHVPDPSSVKIAG